MSNTTTIIGNVTGDAELRFTSSGAAVCNFTVADTQRVKKGDQWEDGETMFVRCAVWRDAAENVSESITKGMRVIVTGKLKVRSYEKDGTKRTSIEMDVDEVGPSLRWATAKVNRTQRSSGGGGQRQQGGFGGGQDAWSQPAQQQRTPEPAWGSPTSENPPF